LRLKILKKLRTASPNSEFTGSYKKSVVLIFMDCIVWHKKMGSGGLNYWQNLKYLFIILFHVSIWRKN